MQPFGCIEMGKKVRVWRAFLGFRRVGRIGVHQYWGIYWRLLRSEEAEGLGGTWRLMVGL